VNRQEPRLRWTHAVTIGGSDGALTVTASFAVDVSTLMSDKTMRDQRIRSIGLESDTYRKATLVLSAPQPCLATLPRAAPCRCR
jgi:hypothetical protein